MTEIENADITVYNRVSLEASSFASAVSYVAICFCNSRLTDEYWEQPDKTGKTLHDAIVVSDIITWPENSSFKYWCNNNLPPNDSQQEPLVFKFKCTGAQVFSYNNIALLDSDKNLLAVRYLGLTYSIKRDDTLTVKVSVSESVDAVFTYDVKFQLDFSDHIQRAEDNLKKEHPRLNSQNNIIADKEYLADKYEALLDKNQNIIREINPDNEDFILQDYSHLQVKTNKPVIFAGKGQTYSHYLWFNWHLEAINNAIQKYIGDINITEDNHPYLGFNGRFGAFLYWYKAIDDHLLWIISGSNSFNNIYIYYCQKPEDIESLPEVSLHSQDPSYRIKCNRWYDSIYFGFNGNIYTVHPCVIKVLEANRDYYVEHDWQDISEKDSSGSIVNSNYMHTEIRVFTDNLCVCDKLELENVYLPEISDFGDVAIQYIKGNNPGDAGQLNYVGLLNKYGFNKGDNDEPTVIDIFKTQSIDLVMNKLVMDDCGKQNNLKGIFRQCALNIKFFLDHRYKIIYLGSNRSIGYDPEHKSYLELINNEQGYSRKRTKLESMFIDDMVINRHCILRKVNTPEGYYRITGDEQNG